MLNIQTEQQYNEIVENYSDMIFRIAYQYLFNKYDAEDIVQEVFVKLLTKRVIFKDEEHIKSWLIRVTINQCLDYKKSLTKKSTVPIENMEIPFEQKEGEILEELQLLKEDERNVLYLHYYEGYKIKEIAKKRLPEFETSVKDFLRSGITKEELISVIENIEENENEK